MGLSTRGTQQKDGVKKKLSYQWHPLVIADQHPESDVLYRVFLENRQRRSQGYIHVNRLRKRISQVQPIDTVLPVPSYDLDYEDLPINSRLLDLLEANNATERKIQIMIQCLSLCNILRGNLLWPRML